MKFKCSQKLLFDAISKVSRAAPSKSSIPALEGIYFKAENGFLYLTAYDLELGIESSIEAMVIESGEIILNARLIFDIVSKIPGESIDVSVDEKFRATLKSGITEFTVVGSSASNYPELPTVNADDVIFIGSDTLKSMIDQTIFAVAQTDNNPIHTGSLFEIKGGELKIVSVDGCRLAIRKEKIDYDGAKEFVVPGKTLMEISRFLTLDEEKEVHICLTRKHILFKIEELTVISRLLEGEFLNYEAVLTNEAKTKVRVNAKDLIDRVNRVSLLISDRLKSPVRCVFEDGLIKLSCITAVGKAYDEEECIIEGDSIEIGFNNRFLADALKAADCEEVILELNTNTSPMQIKPLNSDEFLFLVLPVRLKNE